MTLTEMLANFKAKYENDPRRQEAINKIKLMLEKRKHEEKQNNAGN